MGGWRGLGIIEGQRNSRRYDTRKMGKRQRGVGWRYLHAAVDDHTRLAYVELHDDQKAVSAVAFTQRAVAWFAQRGINVEAVMTDNGSCYVSHLYQDALAGAGIDHIRTRPRRPQTNGKVERFNRTLSEEWAYIELYESETERTAALAHWIHTYNHHRHHTAIGGPPITRVTNLPSQYI